MKGSHISLILAFSLLVFGGCKEDEPLPETGTVTIRLTHVFGGAAAEFDQMIYTNAAGNQLSLTRLEYLLSEFKLTGTSDFAESEVFYFNGRDIITHEIMLEKVPYGDYSGVSFVFGLSEALNISNSLSSEPEFANMFWPDPMGGGYHFMKMEGHFASGNETPGYAFHVGSNGYHIPFSFPQTFTIEGENTYIDITMDLSKWYESPNIYDLEAGPTYTMGNDEAMTRLVDNGHDVYSIDKIW